jgi:hypothetical protein
MKAFKIIMVTIIILLSILFTVGMVTIWYQTGGGIIELVMMTLIGLMITGMGLYFAYDILRN